MLQGTEQPNQPTHRFHGHLQLQMTWHDAEPYLELSGAAAQFNGQTLSRNLVGPTFTGQDRLNIRRAALSWRGKINDNIHYYTLLQAGENALTYNLFGQRARLATLADASLTFNYLPGARIRVGLFKNPSSEENMQGLGMYSYADMSDFQSRNVLEKFVTGSLLMAGSEGELSKGIPARTSYGISGFRDWGIQLFDHWQSKQWDLSYALKVGRGEAISSDLDPQFQPETYAYVSAEYLLPGGQGAGRHGVKTYFWHQRGQRNFASDNENRTYQRLRYGVGIKALGPLLPFGWQQRIQAEWLFANGMIFLAPQLAVVGNPLQYAASTGNQSRGAYFDIGIYLNPQWEIAWRYDYNKHLYATSEDINRGNYRNIQTTTMAINYKVSKQHRFSLNYAHRLTANPIAYNATSSLSKAQADMITENVRYLGSTLADRWSFSYTYLF